MWKKDEEVLSMSSLRVEYGGAADGLLGRPFVELRPTLSVEVRALYSPSAPYE